MGEESNKQTYMPLQSQHGTQNPGNARRTLACDSNARYTLTEWDELDEEEKR